MHPHDFDRHRLSEAVETELGLIWHDTVEDMVKVCDVVTINCLLNPETENLFDAEMIAKMKRGAYLVNTARGKIVERDAVVAALESGQLAGYAGDVWFPQPRRRTTLGRPCPTRG
jgi:formate dehydrogenase